MDHKPNRLNTTCYRQEMLSLHRICFSRVVPCFKSTCRLIKKKKTGSYENIYFTYIYNASVFGTKENLELGRIFFLTSG